MFDPTPIDSTDSTETERFVIDTEEKAEWLLRRLANIEAEKARVKANARKREEELTADYNALMFPFGAELETFARQEAQRRRRQTVTLQNGALAFTKASARLVIGDQSDGITTARAVCPDAVKTETTESLDGRGLLAYAEACFEETGELLPAIDRIEATERFAVRIRDGKE